MNAYRGSPGSTAQREDVTAEIMARIAALLPADLRGAYAIDLARSALTEAQ